MGIASSLADFLRLLCGRSGLVVGAVASFFGLPRFCGTCPDKITSSSLVAAVVLFFGLPRFFGTVPGEVVSVWVNGVDAAASAEPDAATLLFCFLCRVGGSGGAR